MKQLTIIYLTILNLSQICLAQNNNWRLGVNTSTTISFNVLEEFNFCPAVVYSNNKNLVSLGYKIFTQGMPGAKPKGIETYYKRYVTSEDDVFRMFFLFFFEYDHTTYNWDYSYSNYDINTGQLTTITEISRDQKDNYFNIDLGYGFDMNINKNLYFTTGIGIGMYKFHRKEHFVEDMNTPNPIITDQVFWSEKYLSIIVNAGIGYKFNKRIK